MNVNIKKRKNLYKKLVGKTWMKNLFRSQGGSAPPKKPLAALEKKQQEQEESH